VCAPVGRGGCGGRDRLAGRRVDAVLTY